MPKQIFLNILKYFILSIFSLFVLVLLVNSIVSTVDMDFITPYYETSFYKKDKFLVHLVCFLVFTAFLILLRKIKINSKILNPKIIYIFVFGAAVLFTAMTNFEPKSDQGILLSVVENMYNHNFSDFAPGGYIDTYPHQQGLALLLYFLRYIFGRANYLAFHLINAIFLVLYFYSLAGITRIIFKGCFERYTFLFLLIFFPVGFYTVFVYGNLIGLALSLLSVLFTLKCTQQNNSVRHTIFYILLSAVLGAIAVIVKQNYLIFIIGNIIYLLLCTIRDKSIRAASLAIAMIFSQLILSLVVSSVTQKITKTELKGGIPSTAYIAMGLQDDENSFAPGWFNGYNLSVYFQSGQNTKKASEMSVKEIKKSIDKFAADPKYAADFFIKKTLSQWNNPSFQCFWLGQTSAIMCAKSDLSPVANSIFFGRTNNFLVGLLNIIETLILAGAFIFILLEYKNVTLEQLIPATIFIGGFIFHLFWEGKSQYVISYFVLLLPYAAKGYNSFTEKIISGYSYSKKNGIKVVFNNKKSFFKNNYYYFLMAVIFIVLLTVSAKYTKCNLLTDKNTEIEQAYTVKKSSAFSVSSGCYTISPKAYEDMYIQAEGTAENITLGVSSGTGSDLQNFFVDNIRNLYTIRNIKYQMNIDVYNNNAENGIVSLYAPIFSGAQLFEIRKCQDDPEYCFIIWNDTYAITLGNTPNTITIKPFGGEDSQKWLFNKMY